MVSTVILVIMLIKIAAEKNKILLGIAFGWKRYAKDNIATVSLKRIPMGRKIIK